ncbi:MAG: phosphotransferase [Actinomycetota bacterium]
MPELKHDEVQKYLSYVVGPGSKLISVGGMPSTGENDELKGFGYGEPVLIEYELNGVIQKAVLGSARTDGGFGHDFLADRAHGVVLAGETFNKLPRHIELMDTGAITKDGQLISIGAADNFFIFDKYAGGREYFRDLERIKSDGALTDNDRERCRALSKYLTEIHAVKKDAPELYVRRIRDLVGQGECIMGLIDSYPEDWAFPYAGVLRDIEMKCVDWRWRLRDRASRLCVEHGDFHPWNVLFLEDTGTDFMVLDRSRGEFGEAADDVAAMSINYIFYALQQGGAFEGPFKELFEIFWREYLENSGDGEVMTVIQPFYAWRGLVVASPVWYPNLTDEIRQKLFNFVLNMLAADKFSPADIGPYLEKP